MAATAAGLALSVGVPLAKDIIGKLFSHLSDKKQNKERMGAALGLVSATEAQIALLVGQLSKRAEQEQAVSAEILDVLAGQLQVIQVQLDAAGDNLRGYDDDLPSR